MRAGRGTDSERPDGGWNVSSTAFLLILVAVLCAAGILRFYRLDAQSFWNDEGNSARIAERSVRLIVEGAAGDIHPPGYYLLLAGWRSVFGQSEFALRSLSAVSGLVMVLLTGLLGRRLFGPPVGLGAAALSAISPFAIYYAQEARMYALLGGLSAASTYAAVHLWMTLMGEEHRDGAKSVPALGAYVLVNAAGLYTHYAFAFVVVSHNVFFGLRWLVESARGRVGWRAAALWSAGQVGAGLLYLPWVPTALGAMGWSSAGMSESLASGVWGVVRVLTVGVTASAQEGRAAMVLSCGLALAAPWVDGEGREDGRGLSQGWAVCALAAYLLVPLVLFFGFDLYKPAWMKFLIVLLPPFHLLAARGAEGIGRLAAKLGGVSRAARGKVGTGALVVLAGATAALSYPSLRNLYFDEAYARDDYRQLAADMAAQWRPGDAVVLNAPNQWEVFTYYYPDRHVYPAPYRPGPQGAASFLEPLREEYDRLFVVFWGHAESDPRRWIESWLAGHAYRAQDTWYGNVRLSTYGIAGLPEAPEDHLEVWFGESILLRGFSLGEVQIGPGDILPVTLFWEAGDPIDEMYKVTVQLLDAEGGLLGQKDSVPCDGLRPTTTWEPGSRIIDRYGVRVPDGGGERQATVLVAVYHAATGDRLPVRRDGELVGDAVTLGKIVVEASDQ